MIKILFFSVVVITSFSSSAQTSGAYISSLSVSTSETEDVINVNLETASGELITLFHGSNYSINNDTIHLSVCYRVTTLQEPSSFSHVFPIPVAIIPTDYTLYVRTYNSFLETGSYQNTPASARLQRVPTKIGNKANLQ